MADQFCDTCMKESTDESVGRIKEGWFGQEFMGETRKCPNCYSEVRVLWRVFLNFPLIMKGCYRYKMTDIDASLGRLTTHFISRRVPNDHELIRKTRMKGIGIAALILAAAAVLIILINKK